MRRLLTLSAAIAALAAALPAAADIPPDSPYMKGVTIRDASGAQTCISSNPCPVAGPPLVAQSTPTISTSAYTSGNVLGGVQSFTLASSGMITNAEVTFNSGTFSGSVNLILLSASPTGGGTTDHAALALTATDTAKIIGVISLSNCTTLNSGTIVQCQANQPTAQAFNLPSGTTVYAVAQVIGAPTFAGASDATFTLYGVR